MTVSLLPEPPPSVRIFTVRPRLFPPVDGRVWVLQRTSRVDGQPDGLLLWKEYTREEYEVPFMVLTGDLKACCSHLQKLRDSCPADEPTYVTWEPRRPSLSWRGAIVRLARGTSISVLSEEGGRMRAYLRHDRPPIGKDGDVALVLRWAVVSEEVPVGPFESEHRQIKPPSHPRPSFEFALREYYTNELRLYDERQR